MQKMGKFNIFCFDKGFGLQQALKIRVAGPVSGNFKDLKTAPTRIVRTKNLVRRIQPSHYYKKLVIRMIFAEGQFSKSSLKLQENKKFNKLIADHVLIKPSQQYHFQTAVTLSAAQD
jgi:hypothetical protein